ncbi:hypothetical protein [Kribbella catacumbae]|uniref:hypothetical protein n=1 Tax=Kribbella catacumbae TaxID=460086 RepID=UPI00146CE953|nr:hypothetical protein [Kribbella catacumbae]
MRKGWSRYATATSPTCTCTPQAHLNFKHNGKVRTAEFTINTAARSTTTPSATTGQAHHGGHG